MRQRVFRIVCAIGALVAWVLNVAGMPDDARALAGWIDWLGQMLDHRIAAIGIAVGLTALVIPPSRWKQWVHFLKGDAPSPAPAPAPPLSIPKLVLSFDPNHNLVPDPNGSVDVRMVLRNPGPPTVGPPTLCIAAMEAITNAVGNSAYSSQFTGCPLAPERPPEGGRMVPGAPYEFRLVRADKNDEWFYFHSSEQEYRVPRGRYGICVGSYAEGAEGVEQWYVVDMREDGELTFEPALRTAEGQIQAVKRS